MESPQTVYAGATVFTGMRVTLVQFKLAILARKTLPTSAGKMVNSIHTRPIVQTRGFSAVWDITFTIDAVIAWRALACVAVHVVCAVSSIPAGVAGALVHLFLTALAIKTSSALAQVPAHFINTCTPVTAWIRAAVIDVGLAVVPAVSRRAFTTVAANYIHTASTILTRALLTLVFILCALGSLPAAVAFAGVAGIIQRWLTDSSSLTGLRGTWDQLLLTVFTCVRWFAVAYVAVDSIHTGSLIHAGV